MNVQKREAYGPLPTLTEQVGLGWVGDQLARTLPPPDNMYCANGLLLLADYVEDVEYTFEDCDTFAVYGFDWMN